MSARALRLVALLGTLATAAAPPGATAQIVAGTIAAPAGAEWVDHVVYHGGQRLFIADRGNSRLLVYDALSLAFDTEVSLASFAPRRPQGLALHEGTGTLYVAVDTGFATSDTSIVVVDADSLAVGPALNGLGMGLVLIPDEARARVYTQGLDASLRDTLTAIDVVTGAVVGTLSLRALMGGGSLTLGRLNPATGELLFTNIHEDKYLVVHGPTMTGAATSAAGARGWAGGWNWTENKVYVTRIAWDGYFVQDRDTGATATTTCVNDATTLFFSERTNRIYTDAEIDGVVTVIDGASDACHDLPAASGLTGVGVVAAAGQVYFAGTAGIHVLDEDSSTFGPTLPNCSAGAFGGVDTEVVVDQAAPRVFVRTWWSSPSPGSCVLAVDPVAPRPDLVVSSLSNPPAVVLLKSKFPGTDTTCNTGTVPAAATKTAFYLSTDAVRDGGDRLVGKRSVPVLPAGACSTGTANLTVAAAVKLGTYRLLACADQLAAVSEGNEADNCRVAAGVVDVRAPDLVVTTLAVPPGPVSPGGTMVVGDTVLNQGTGDAGSSITRFYLSRDAKKTALDVRLTETRLVAPLSVGATSAGTTTVTLPAATAAGAYYLIACADDLKKVAESAAWEKNNCRVSASAIAVSP
jgi:hypothetical protein